MIALDSKTNAVLTGKHNQCEEMHSGSLIIQKKSTCGGDTLRKKSMWRSRLLGKSMKKQSM